jgi:hypothetical protein
MRSATPLIGCGVLNNDAANNGMHPTADTLPLIYFQRCGAAGDAGR